MSSIVTSSIGAVRTNRPSRMIVTRWQQTKTSSSRCEMNSTAAPLRAQGLDDVEQPLDLDRGQRGGRLVHDQHPRVERQRLGDLDDLLVGDRQPAGGAGRVQGDAETGEDRAGVALHRPPVDAPPTAERLAADEDVLGDGEVGEQRRLLVDDRDAGGLGRRPGRENSTGAAVDGERAAVGPVHPAEDLDQRRLAGAVLAEQRVRLAGVAA